MLLVLALVGCDGEPESAGTAIPTRADDLAYRVCAQLARRGIFASFHGADLDGLTLSLKSASIITRYGGVLAKDIRIGLSAAPGPIWGSFVPAISVHAKSARVVAKRGGGESRKAEVREGSSDFLHTLARIARAPALQMRVDALHVRGIAGAVQVRATAYPFSGKREVVAGLYNKDIDLFARVTDEGKAITGRVAAKRIALPALARGLRAMGRKAKMLQSGAAYGVAEFAVESGAVEAKVAGHVQDLCIEQRRLGEGPACGLSLGGAARLGASRERIFVESSVLHIGSVSLRAEGLLPLTGGDYDFTLHVPAQPIQNMLSSIPKQWRTGLFGFELDGTARADLSIRGSGDDLEIDPSFSFTKVAVAKAPAGQDPRRLNGPVTWVMPFPYAHTVSFAQESGYTPMSAIPQLLVDAVRISEDASFYGHDGFDRDQIAKALIDLKGGQGARGASTITQQLAKNLYFDGDRNLTRKIEEAIVTAALEASVSKHRLLEIYLNVIEWGDGVFGVARASRHYFDKEPYELTGREIAFLAGIIPAPRKVDRELRTLGASAWAEKRTQRVAHFLCEVGKLAGEMCNWESAGDETTLTTAN